MNLRFGERLEYEVDEALEVRNEMMATMRN